LEARPELLAYRWPDLVGDRQEQLPQCWHGGFAELLTKHHDENRQSWPDRAARNGKRACHGCCSVLSKAVAGQVEHLLHRVVPCSGTSAVG